MSDLEVACEDHPRQTGIEASGGGYLDASRFDGILNPRERQEEPAAAPLLSGGVARTAIGRPIVYVTYFCSSEPSSLAAGVRDGLAKLATFAGGHADLRPGASMVRYRNWRDGSVTIDIGLPLEHLPDLPVDVDVAVGEWIDAGSFGRRVARSLGEAITSLREAIATEDPQELADPDPAWQLELADGSTTAASSVTPTASGPR